MFCLFTHQAELAQKFKIAVWQSDFMKQNFGRFIFTPFEWVGCQRCRFWGSWLYYKAREGSLNERLTYMKALRHANNIDVNRYPGMRSNDVFLQMIDLDKGIYGQPFLVSLFLHNQAREERSIKITMITNSMYYTGQKVNFWPCQRNLIKTFQYEANPPLITKITLKTFLNIFGRSY